MTTDTADRAIVRIHRALLKYGTDAVLRATPTSGPSHNPTLGADVDTPCRILPTKWDFKESQDSRILATDRKFAMEADGLTVTGANLAKQKLVTGDPLVAYTIVNASPAELQGKKVLWWLQARA